MCVSFGLTEVGRRTSDRLQRRRWRNRLAFSLRSRVSGTECHPLRSPVQCNGKEVHHRVFIRAGHLPGQRATILRDRHITAIDELVAESKFDLRVHPPIGTHAEFVVRSDRDGESPIRGGHHRRIIGKPAVEQPLWIQPILASDRYVIDVVVVGRGRERGGVLTARDGDIDLAELTPIFPAKIAHDRPRVAQFMIATEDHVLWHGHAQIEIAGQEAVILQVSSDGPQVRKCGRGRDRWRQS